MRTRVAADEVNFESASTEVLASHRAPRVPRADVLLVEDDRDYSGMVRALLEQSGEVSFAVDHVESLAEATSLLAKKHYDLVVSDLRLSDSSGRDTISKVLLSAGGTAVIVLTGDEDEQLALEAVGWGAQDYVVKHRGTTWSLLRSIRFAIARGALLRKLEAQAEELRSRQSELEAIFEGTLSPMVLVNAAGRIVQVNHAAAQYARESQDSLIGSHFGVSLRCARLDGSPPCGAGTLCDDCVIRRSIDDTLASGNIHERVETRMSVASADPTERIVEFTTSLVRAAGENRALLCFDDVTERRTAEQRFREAQRMDAVGRLAGGVAHDFNNALTTIRSYCSFLSKAVANDRQSLEDLREIRETTERAAQLTRQLLAFSGRQTIRPVVLDVNEVVAGFEKLLRRVIGERVMLETKLRDDLGVISVDPGQIEQVLINLVVNAKEAMPDGGVITVETSPATAAEARGAGVDHAEGEYVRISVRDAGTGMSADCRAHAFEPFFTTKTSGKGLGLAIVHGIVRQNGGGVTIESTLGQGTTLHVLLPQAKPAPRMPISARLRAASSRTDVGVLLVENDETVRKTTGRLLRTVGYDVTEVSSPGDALLRAEMRAESIDVVLVDVVTPLMSGDELVRRLRAMRPHVAVVFMSGHGGESPEIGAALQPGVELLQKPFSEDALFASVEAVLTPLGNG